MEQKQAHIVQMMSSHFPMLYKEFDPTNQKKTTSRHFSVNIHGIKKKAPLLGYFSDLWKHHRSTQNSDRPPVVAAVPG